MRTIINDIEDLTTSHKSPSTWTDERSHLKAEIRELKVNLRMAHDAAPELLAVVRDLAYGGNVSFTDKVANARAVLEKAGLVTRKEQALSGKPIVTRVEERLRVTERGETEFYDQPLIYR